ncbi:MAG: ABC transporter ATP-binding protein [Spirochaetaceae bacterium]|nr:MAG: ABC transporter ATP-binding protein [Spirochaetaceae bacterium]
MGIVNIENVTKEYKLGKTVVRALGGVSLSIEKGEFLTIAGPSGSGKSTLLSLIGCLDAPTSGEIHINNKRITGLSEHELGLVRRDLLGFIFQSFNLIPVLDVNENIELPLVIHREITQKERQRRVKMLVEETGLSEHVRKKPHELSGGQQQRVAIARALVTKPDVILADEPTANLDSLTAQTVIELMHRINRESGTTFVFSSHDPAVTVRADRVVHLHDGMITLALEEQL